MNLLTIYQNLKSIFSKLRKSNIVNEEGNYLEDFTVTVDGEVIPRWLGGMENSLTRTGEADDENKPSVDTVS